MDVPSHSHGSISFVDLAASDPDLQGRFYTELLGWERLDIGDGVYTMFTWDGSPVAGMVPLNADHTDLASAWTTYVTVEDADGSCAQARELGGDVLRAPIDLPGGGRVGMITDPSGASLCVFEGFDGGFRVFDEPGAPCWFEEMSTNADAALSFYEALLGWVPTKMDGVPIDYWTVTTEAWMGQAFAGVMQLPADASAQGSGARSAWQVSFSIHTDIATFVAHAIRLGAEVVAGPSDTAFGSGAIIGDPVGAVFGAIDRSTATS